MVHHNERFSGLKNSDSKWIAFGSLIFSAIYLAAGLIPTYLGFRFDPYSVITMPFSGLVGLALDFVWVIAFWLGSVAFCISICEKRRAALLFSLFVLVISLALAVLSPMCLWISR